MICPEHFDRQSHEGDAFLYRTETGDKAIMDNIVHRAMTYIDFINSDSPTVIDSQFFTISVAMQPVSHSGVHHH